MKTILVPTDFSSYALRAAQYGVQLFKEEDIKLILLHVNTNSKDSETPTNRFSMKSRKSMAALNAEAAIIKDHVAAPLNVEVLYEDGDLLKVTMKLLKELDIDMILMGTKGETPDNNSAFGSNAADMIQYVDHPLIVVPEMGEFYQPKSILFAADYRDFSNPTVLAPLSELAGHLKAQVKILYVMSKEEEINPETAAAGLKLNDYFGEEVSHTFHYLEYDNPTEGIKVFIENHKPDMLAMVARHREIFDHLFHESITKEMSLHLTLPLLALHDPG